MKGMNNMFAKAISSDKKFSSIAIIAMAGSVVFAAEDCGKEFGEHGEKQVLDKI